MRRPWRSERNLPLYGSMCVTAGCCYAGGLPLPVAVQSAFQAAVVQMIRVVLQAVFQASAAVLSHVVVQAAFQAA